MSEEKEKKVTEKIVEIKEEKIVKKSKKKEFFTGTGRRKTAVASVWLYTEKGEMMVNDKLIKEYFPGADDSIEWVKPFHSIGISHPQAKYSATIKVRGGGVKSQVEAVRLGISRALVDYNAELKPVLASTNLLTRDSREVERKKPYFRKARKKPQYSKR